MRRACRAAPGRARKESRRVRGCAGARAFTGAVRAGPRERGHRWPATSFGSSCLLNMGMDTPAGEAGMRAHSKAVKGWDVLFSILRLSCGLRCWLSIPAGLVGKLGR